MEGKPKLTVRLKDDRIILRLGSESTELGVIDGLTDDAAHLAKTIQGRIQEVLAKRRRSWTETYKQLDASRQAEAGSVNNPDGK